MTQKRRGRPPLSQNEPTVRICITVTESQAEYLQKFGNGNASSGARRLLEEKHPCDGCDFFDGFKCTDTDPRYLEICRYNPHAIIQNEETD